MTNIQVIGFEQDDLLDKAQQLANQLNFTVEKNAPSCLLVTDHKLCLKMPGFSPLAAELSTKFWHKRTQEGKKQGLVRACKPCAGLKIIDATAGWGKESALLASFGATVLMLERHPIMAALLRDGLARMQAEAGKSLDLSLQVEDSFTFLKSLASNDYPDVIYIDPMHPERTKSALVKKEMQALQAMIGPDRDALPLIELAIARVKQRVVVKWPQKSKALIPAGASVEGKTVRFDIYFPHRT